MQTVARTSHRWDFAIGVVVSWYELCLARFEQVEASGVSTGVSTGGSTGGSTGEVLVSVEVILGERYRRPIARQGSVVLLLKRVATLEVLCDEADPTVFSDCCDILRCLWDWGHLWWEGHVLCCMCRLSFVWEEKLCRTNRSCAHVCVFAVVRAVLAVVWAFVLARREESSTGRLVYSGGH